MSGMAIKFTSLAQIEANRFVPTDEGGQNSIGWRAVSAQNVDRQRQDLTHYRIYQLDAEDYIVSGHSAKALPQKKRAMRKQYVRAGAIDPARRR